MKKKLSVYELYFKPAKRYTKEEKENKYLEWFEFFNSCPEAAVKVITKNLNPKFSDLDNLFISALNPFFIETATNIMYLNSVYNHDKDFMPDEEKAEYEKYFNLI